MYGMRSSTVAADEVPQAPCATQFFLADGRSRASSSRPVPGCRCISAGKAQNPRRVFRSPGEDRRRKCGNSRDPLRRRTGPGAEDDAAEFGRAGLRRCRSPPDSRAGRRCLVLGAGEAGEEEPYTRARVLCRGYISHARADLPAGPHLRLRWTSSARVRPNRTPCSYCKIPDRKQSRERPSPCEAQRIPPILQKVGLRACFAVQIQPLKPLKVRDFGVLIPFRVVRAHHAVQVDPWPDGLVARILPARDLRPHRGRAKALGRCQTRPAKETARPS